jgi:DNA polymerase-1
MKTKATTRDAYQLLQDGSMVMAEMEANGICVDVNYIKRTQAKIQKRVEHLTEQLKRDKIFKVWKSHFGSKTKIGSRSQLATLLFDIMNYPNEYKTATERYSADVDALDDVGIPFTKRYIECEKLKKAKNTYLVNILRETVDGIIHPNFNLNTVRTYRGSSDHPNFTNMPMRDPLIKKLIRRSFKARKGCHMVDLDFKGSEVNAAAWYHKDPRMLRYIKTDPGKMHTDMARQIYMLPSKEMTPIIRYCGKNMFVFPQFYGDWWLSCAHSLWRAIDKLNLKTTSGIPLKKWLKKKGITELGTHDPKNVDGDSFEAHLKDVEYDFWHNRFGVYQDWKEEWWDEYQATGSFQMLTGFEVSGYINRKQAINWPIQGTAFHCLLWSLIRIGKLLRKYKMKSRLIGQIHDDAVGDVPKRELKDYIDIATEVVSVDLPKHWPFIITPMRVEVEVTPLGGSWYDKKEYTL